jgi:hypothetical protein
MKTCVSGVPALLLCLFVPASLGCEIPERDQISLKDLMDSVPAAGSAQVSAWPKHEVLCGRIGDLRVLSIPDLLSYFVLDPKRAFDRWSETGAAFGSDPKAALKSFLQLYRGMDAEALWLNYGRLQFTADELSNLRLPADLKWTKLRLIPADTLALAARERLNNPAQEALIRRLVRDQVRNWLVVNAELTSSSYELKHTPVRLYTSAIVARVSVRRDGHSREIELRLPINAACPPFVGYPNGR